ncbi:MAG: 30S ribosomal protein S3 [Firmicutes bacterium]|nr:30S ribosomal protein S3 [Bacillota bacterium]
MGQKVNPHGFRVGVNKDWSSTWVAPKKDIATFIKEDNDIRKYIMENYSLKSGLNNCSISKVTIERTAGRVAVNIYTGRPGMLIGQKGAGIDGLKKSLQKIVGTKSLDVNVREVKNMDADATLVAQSIASQLEKRASWRRAMKMAMQKAMKSGVQGVKVMVGGRLDGADIARSEHYQTGILPLHTLRSDIEYGFAEASTTFGIIGVKCWICHGEIKGKTRRTGEVVRASRTERDNRRPQQGDRKPFNGPRRPFDPNRPRPEGGFRPEGGQGGFNRGPRPEGGFARPEGGYRPRPEGAAQGGYNRGPRPEGQGQSGAPKNYDRPARPGERVFVPKQRPAGPKTPTQGGAE